MPKFFYSVIITLLLLWGSLVFLVLKIAPSTYWNIFLFLIVFFLALGISFSIPIYMFSHKKNPGFVDLKVLFRKSVKWGMFFSLGVTGTLFLRALDLFNILNFGLFLLLFAGIFFQLKDKR